MARSKDWCSSARPREKIACGSQRAAGLRICAYADALEEAVQVVQPNTGTARGCGAAVTCLRQLGHVQEL